MKCIDHLQKILMDRVGHPISLIEAEKLAQEMTGFVRDNLQGSLFSGISVGLKLVDNKLDITLSKDGMPLDTPSQSAIWILLGNLYCSDTVTMKVID